MGKLKKYRWLNFGGILVVSITVIGTLVVVPISLKSKKYETIGKGYLYIVSKDSIDRSFAVRDLKELDNLLDYYCHYYDTTFTWH